MSTRLTLQSRPTGGTTHCSRVAPRGSPPAQPLSPDTATARLPQERSTSRPHTPSSTKTPAAHTLKLLTLHTHVYNKNSNYMFNIKLHFQCNSRQCVSEKEVVHLRTWAHLRCTATQNPCPQQAALLPCELRLLPHFLHTDHKHTQKCKRPTNNMKFCHILDLSGDILLLPITCDHHYITHTSLRCCVYELVHTMYVYSSEN